MRKILLPLLLVLALAPALAQRTHKAPLHGKEWMAVTGKPLGAVAGARIFIQGGNAVDAACAMLAATATMWDVLHWGGETQALIWDPRAKKVVGINALGVAPSGATPEFFRAKGFDYPPPYGPLAAVTPGTPGGLLVMLAEYGRLSLAQVLQPAIEMADGYPIEGQTARYIEEERKEIEQWPDSRRLFFPNPGGKAPEPGQLFRQPELAATLRKLVDAERQALAGGADRKAAIRVAYDRFYKGDIAEQLVASVRAQGGLFTREDLANWQVRIEEPVKTTYKGIDVYKLTAWTQGPVMLQALNILEHFDLKAMGFNSTRYVHTVYQAMNLAYADRDFYYGDTTQPPEEPVAGLLSKDYAKSRAKLVNAARNDPVETLARAAHQAPRAGRRHTDELVGPDERVVLRRHHVGGRGRQGGLAGVDHTERWMDSGGRRWPDRHRAVAAHAELRARRRRESFQRCRAGQTTARDADADAGDEGRRAVAGIRDPGRRRAGSAPASVLPEHRRVRHDPAGGSRGAGVRQRADARVLRAARIEAGHDLAQRRDAAVRAQRARPHGLQARLRRAHDGAGQRDPNRPEAPHVLGRVGEPRRGSRHRLVNHARHRPLLFTTARQ